MTRTGPHHGESADEERDGEERSCNHGPCGRTSDPNADAGHASHGPRAKPAATRPLSDCDDADECARRIVGRTEFEGLDRDNESFNRLDVGLSRRASHRAPSNGSQARSGTAFEFAVGRPDASHSVGHGEPGFCVGNRSLGITTHYALDGNRARPSQSVESTPFGKIGVESFERQGISHTVRIDAHFGRRLDECLAGHAHTAQHGVGVIVDAVFLRKRLSATQYATRFVSVEWYFHTTQRNVDES